MTSFLVLCTLCILCVSDVIRCDSSQDSDTPAFGFRDFWFEREEQETPEIGYRGFFSGNKARKFKVKNYNYKSCGSPSDPAKLDSLEIKHDGDGDIDVSLQGTTDIDVIAPVSANVSVSRKVLGIWIPMPCANKLIGSCYYEDLCKFGLKSCPFKSLRDAGIPCNCPISKGSYSLRKANLPVPKSSHVDMLKGFYKGKLDIYMGDGKRLACYEFNAQVQ